MSQSASRALPHGAPSGRPTPPPNLAAIFAAVPGGSRRCRSQREWLRAALAEIEAQGWYSNRKASTAGVARRLALSMDWRKRIARPGHENVAVAVGVSTDTVARAVAWLASNGFLGLVSGGALARMRPGVLHRDNWAAVYVLTVPRRRPRTSGVRPGHQDFADPSGTGFVPGNAQARARETKPEVKPETARPPAGLPVLPPGASALHHHPRTRAEAWAVAAAVRARSRHLGRISVEHLRHLARPYFRAGWNGLDVLIAVDHEPSGRQHGYVSAPRSPGRWAASRLSLWLGPDGLPIPSRSQLAAADRARVLDEQAWRRAARRPPSGYAEGAALARALMTGRLAQAPARRRPAPGTPSASR